MGPLKLWSVWSCESLFMTGRHFKSTHLSCIYNSKYLCSSRSAQLLGALVLLGWEFTARTSLRYPTVWGSLFFFFWPLYNLITSRHDLLNCTRGAMLFFLPSPEMNRCIFPGCLNFWAPRFSQNLLCSLGLPKITLVSLLHSSYRMLPFRTLARRSRLIKHILIFFHNVPTIKVSFLWWDWGRNFDCLNQNDGRRRSFFW